MYDDYRRPHDDHRPTSVVMMVTSCATVMPSTSASSDNASRSGEENGQAR
jgi:hypothetical protein